VSLSLFCFVTEPAKAASLLAGGVAGLVVDWERRGKDVRQAGADTEISTNTLSDLIAVREVTTAPILCRVNPPGPWSGREIEDAIRAGADELLVPMIRRASEVDEMLDLVGRRVPVGILIETEEAVANARKLAQRPLSRAYLGLNDLAIERRSESIFVPLVDGTAERVAAALGTIPFGFGGLTLPDRGHPIPSRLLIGGMVRMRCGFTFLRRSFWRDIGRDDPASPVFRIRAALDDAARRSPMETEANRTELELALTALTASGSPAS
jgi:hypothetical protein